MEDYLVVNPNNGAVKIWWNYGPDASWFNGWKFVEGGQIATGVPHANLATLRFPDINGDGRADYVYIGEGGSLRHFMNTGTVGGQDVLFLDQGGIASGATSNITKLVFADVRMPIPTYSYTLSTEHTADLVHRWMETVVMVSTGEVKTDFNIAKNPD